MADLVLIAVNLLTVDSYDWLSLGFTSVREQPWHLILERVLLIAEMRLSCEPRWLDLIWAENDTKIPIYLRARTTLRVYCSLQTPAMFSLADWLAVSHLSSKMPKKQQLAISIWSDAAVAFTTVYPPHWGSSQGHCITTAGKWKTLVSREGVIISSFSIDVMCFRCIICFIVLLPWGFLCRTTSAVSIGPLPSTKSQCFFFYIGFWIIAENLLCDKRRLWLHTHILFSTKWASLSWCLRCECNQQK